MVQAKRRPALVLAALPDDDLILAQITGQSVREDVDAEEQANRRGTVG